MNVAELIEILNQCNPELRVVVANDDGGVSDVETAKLIPIILHDSSYGRHEPCESYEQDELALILSAFGDDEEEIE
jgi:hypothetical protein